MFRKLLIANRGEIAVRIMRTARRLGIATAAIHSDADRRALHVSMADEAFHIGPSPALQSYLNPQAIIAAALASGAEAVHPGYGFLSENPDFAEAVAAAGLIFVGPPPEAIRAMGLKDRARALMQKAGVPLVPGYHGGDQDEARLAAEARRIGYPVLVKPVAGGGGKGMRTVATEAELAEALAAAQREAQSAFGNGDVLLEKFIARARHIEVQIMADAQGNVLHLFERDCSLQRRNQKVMEEAPAPGMTPEIRASLCSAAVAAARQVGYQGAGTVEFIADVADGLRPERIYFIEMNTRLQVEHPVTEMITGLDLVEMQLRVASGEALALRQDDVAISGHAVEARVYAEDPARDFQPQAGRITGLHLPDGKGLRADFGVRQGDVVQPYYDPMIGKLIAHAPTRREAWALLARALAVTGVQGCCSNLSFLYRLALQKDVLEGNPDVSLIGRHAGKLTQEAEPPAEVIAVALLHADGRLAAPEGHSPFDTLRGFRLWGGDTRVFPLRIGGATRHCSLEGDGHGFTVSDGGKTLQFSLAELGPERVSIDSGSRIVSLRFSHDDGVLTVICDGKRYEIGFERSDVRKGEEGDQGSVAAPVPGLVGKVLFKAGDKVRRGELIAVIEAIKMEFPLKAGRDGVLCKVNAAEGDQVSEGMVIAEIAEDGSHDQQS